MPALVAFSHVLQRLLHGLTARMLAGRLRCRPAGIPVLLATHALVCVDHKHELLLYKSQFLSQSVGGSIVRRSHHGLLADAW